MRSSVAGMEAAVASHGTGAHRPVAVLRSADSRCRSIPREHHDPHLRTPQRGPQGLSPHVRERRPRQALARASVGAGGPVRPGDRRPVRARRSSGSGAIALAWVAAGYVFWTLLEYWLHRVVFHFEPADGLGARLHWIIHGVHHDHPNDPMRLVMPPSVSVPLALMFYGALPLVLGSDRAMAFGAGFLAGLPRLRHDALLPAPPRRHVALRAAAARAPHAPPLPGPHARASASAAPSGTACSARRREGSRREHPATREVAH